MPKRFSTFFKIFSTAHASPPAIKFSLLARGGLKNDNIFPLIDRAIGIGTDPNSCAIIYPQGTAGIAQFHCQLVPQGGGWTITDFSDSGTWLNGTKMNKFQAYPLNVGDVFYIASLENSFCLQSEVVNNPAGANFQPPVSPVNPQRNFGQIGITQPSNPAQGQFQNINRGQGLPVTSPSWTDNIKEKFFTWEGRLNRKPYILRGLILSLISFAVQFIVAFILALVGTEGDTIVYVCTLASFPFCVPGIMLGIRRLHDTDRSGWWLLIGFVPLVNFYVLYLLLFKKGSVGANRFGADPMV